MIEAIHAMPWPIFAIAIWLTMGFVLLPLGVLGYIQAVENDERIGERSICYWLLVLLAAPARFVMRLGN